MINILKGLQKHNVFWFSPILAKSEQIFINIEQILRYIHALIKNARYFFFPNLRVLFSSRVRIRGKYPVFNQLTHITGKGQLEIGKNCIFGYKPGGFHKQGLIEFQTRNVNAKIIIKENVFTNNNIFICASNHIEIGEGTLIGQHVTLMDFEAHGSHPDQRRLPGKIGKIIIGRNVWIGNNVTILKNSIIGDNTIIATGAVVSGVFKENLIIGGVPARIIKNNNENWIRKNK